MKEKKVLNLRKILKFLIFSLIVICISVIFIPDKYLNNDVSKKIVDNEQILSKDLETYKCGSKNRDTCADYIFTFKDKSLTVERHTYYSYHMDDKITLYQNYTTLTSFGLFIIILIIVIGGLIVFVTTKLVSDSKYY